MCLHLPSTAIAQGMGEWEQRPVGARAETGCVEVEGASEGARGGCEWVERRVKVVWRGLWTQRLFLGRSGGGLESFLSSYFLGLGV